MTDEKMNDLQDNIRSDVANKVKRDIEHLVADRSIEMENRNRRKLNIIVFNWEEGSSKKWC